MSFLFNFLGGFVSASLGRTPRQGRSRRRRDASRRRAPLWQGERLEERQVLSAVPFGALPQDTAEFLMGKVLVNVVLLESTGAIDPSTEDWTPQLKQDLLAKISDSFAWWEALYAKQWPQGVAPTHPLEFVINTQWVDNPLPTPYEPINRPAEYFVFYVNDFLTQVGFNKTGDFLQDIRSYNHSTRVAHDTNWAFTLFIANSTNDPDDRFPPGAYTGAFAYRGGALIVAPSGRPTITFTHELGHIFWAFDEYPNGDPHSASTGYFGVQNLNGANGAPQGFVQEMSIMADGFNYLNAYQQVVSPTSTLAHIGWRDSDGDGVMDVYDVPQLLTGLGRYDAATGQYRFSGSATVVPLLNRNPEGIRSDITLARIGAVEYRVDGGAWQVVQTPDSYTVDLDLQLGPLSAQWSLLEIRTRDTSTGVTSNLFQATSAAPQGTARPGISGYLWNDANANSQWDGSETPLAGWNVRLVNQLNQVVSLSQRLEPDHFGPGSVLNTVLPNVALSTIGAQALGSQVRAIGSTVPNAGSQIFGAPVNGGTTDRWTPTRQLRIAFPGGASHVSIATIGHSSATSSWPAYGRLEIYDSAGNLLGRSTSGPLVAGQLQRLELSRPGADIAYAIAYGAQSDGVVLDNLIVGPAAVQTTNIRGMFHFPNLPAGSYRVMIGPAPGWQATSVVARDVTHSVGGAVGNLSYSFRFVAGAAPYYNVANPYDVNGDGGLNISDLLALRNYYRSHGLGTPAPPSGPVTTYFDVDGDGVFSLSDVLLVRNAVRDVMAGTGTGAFPSPPSSEPGDSAGAATASGEGELPSGLADAVSASNEPATAELPPLGSTTIDRDSVAFPAEVADAWRQTSGRGADSDHRASVLWHLWLSSAGREDDSSLLRDHQEERN